MRIPALAVLALMFVRGMAVAQQTRTEVTTPVDPTTNVNVQKPAVPDVYAIVGQFDHIAVLRIKYQVDLLAGLENVVRQERIRNAVILAGIGSVRNYQFHVVSNRDFPTKNIFVRDSTAPADIAGMNGYVIDGRVHAHITLADGGKAFGGHLEPGTSVFTFAIVTLGVFKDGIDLRRIDDTTQR